MSAIEFATLLPLLLILLFGGYATTTTIALSRKITITTRALADLTSQYSTLAQSDITNIFNASTQIMAPFNSTPLGMRITEVTLDATGMIATVTWSKAYGTGVSQYVWGSPFIGLPAGMTGKANANVNFIFSQTYYAYTPPFGTTIVGQIMLGDHIYMLPRASSSVVYTGT